MSETIVIGARGETTGYAAAGLRCFEPEHLRLVERVRAERKRCDVLALTRLAFEALPCALARDLRQSAWPRLAILPSSDGAADVPALIDDLVRLAAAPEPAAA